MCWRLRAYSLPCDVICGESSRNVSVLFTIYVPMCSLTLSLNAFLSLKAAAACWNCNHSFAHVSKTYTVSGQGKYTCILVWFIGISTVYFSLPPSLSLFVLNIFCMIISVRLCFDFSRIHSVCKCLPFVPIEKRAKRECKTEQKWKLFRIFINCL